MQAKTIAMLSYVTIIGWLIAYLQHKKSKEKSTLCAYHLEQGLGLFLCSLALGIILNVINLLIASLSGMLSILGILPLIFMILGLITANNAALKPLPIIGSLFEGKFKF